LTSVEEALLWQTVFLQGRIETGCRHLTLLHSEDDIPMKPSPKAIVRWLILALVAGVVVFTCLAIQSQRRAAQREQAARADRKIGFVLHSYDEAAKKFPRFMVHEESVSFGIYSGYFVSNQFEPHAPESFVVITSQGQFDGVLGVAAVMNDKSHRLPEDAFKSLIVLAAITRGHAVVEYKVDEVVVKEGVVDLRYTTTPKKSDTATFASPLIVSIPKGKYSAVRFIEDGKVVKEIGMDSGREGQADGKPLEVSGHGGGGRREGKGWLVKWAMIEW
jgi:hypothetical protein